MSESETHENYAGVYDTALGYGHSPAIILIDFVQAYFNPENELFADPRNALGSALRLRQLAHEKNVPVILTTVTYDVAGRTGGVFFKKARPLRQFLPNAPDRGWPNGLVPNAADILINKQYPSAFFGTSLSSTLTAMNVDTLIITGLTTSGCVRATCVDCCSHGFRPIVVKDACGDRHPAPHAANLFDMNAKYADVVSEANATQYFTRLNL